MNRAIDRADLADDVIEHNEAVKFEVPGLLSLRNCRERTTSLGDCLRGEPPV